MVPRVVRNRLKSVTPAVARGLSGRRGGAVAGKVAVLCYHSVNTIESGLSVDPRTLREQIGLLRAHNFMFLSVGDLVERLVTRNLPTQPAAVLTFDDGFADNLIHLVPILEDLGIPATCYVTTGLMLRDAPVLERMRKLTGYAVDYLTPEQVAEMSRRGVEVGAHTHTHHNLARLSNDEARKELSESKRLLEDVIGRPVLHFAYPFGKRMIHYTPDTVRIAEECGFRSAVAAAFRRASASDRMHLFEIPRFFVNRGDNLPTFQEKAFGYFDWLGCFHEHSPAWLKALVSPEEKYE